MSGIGGMFEQGIQEGPFNVGEEWTANTKVLTGSGLKGFLLRKAISDHFSWSPLCLHIVP